MSDDYTAGTSTNRALAVGGGATGTAERRRHVDGVAVDLVAGGTGVIHREGRR